MINCGIFFREVAAVTKFIQSEKDFHIMRDNPQHGVPIMGGTWGIKLKNPETRRKMSLAIRRMFRKNEFFAPRNVPGPDQDILKHIIW